MVEIVRDILTSDAGSFGFVFALLALAFWLVYFITHKITLINSKHSEVSEKMKKGEGVIDDIRKDLTYLKVSMDVINKDVSFLKDSLNDINKDITFLKSSFDILKGADPLLQSHSPIGLSELGVKVAQELKAEEMIKKNWCNIFEILNSELKDSTPYDIQEYCILEVSVAPEKFFTKEDLNNIKSYAFNHGRPVELYTRMIGILIRDAYLKEKGIDISAIDDSAPIKVD